MMTTDRELKLLASKQPELVVFRLSNEDNLERLYWNAKPTDVGKLKQVTDREMDWLIRQAEEKLTVNELSIYADNLDAICVPTHICPLTHWQAVILSTWQQRLEALCRVWEQENNL